MALYELTKTAITALDETKFAMQDFNERRDLQRLLKQQIEVIAPDTLIIAEELCEWDESLRRIDLLGIDRNANLVVVEADLYTVQLKKKAEENRQAKHFAPDFSKYDLTVDGSKQLHLTKRRLVLEVIRAAIAKGFSLEQIESMVPPNRWISVVGDLTPEEFQEEASKLQAKLGGKYDLRRYFCDDGELFQIDGRTYALSNQWSVTTIPVVDEIIAQLPAGTVTYVKADLSQLT